MILPTSFLGIFLALASGFVWGSGDFTGGFASRRSHSYTVLTLSAFSGLVVLIIIALALREPFPEPRAAVWALLGGIFGALGIAMLYRALSIGHAATVAPIAGVLSAALPVIYSAAAHGLPGAQRMVGFALALAGIWLVSAGAGPAPSSAPDGAPNGARGWASQEVLMACAAGVCFGLFFIFLGLIQTSAVFTPLILARSMTLLTGLVMLRIARLPLPFTLPRFTQNPPALLAGLLDAGGNLLYILANQYTRLDVAAVLASLYPAATVLLSALMLKERVSLSQGLGVLACLAAIVLITL